MRSFNAEHTTDDTDAATANHVGYRAVFSVESSGAPAVADTGPSCYGLYVDLPETYNVNPDYHNNDGTYTFERWAIFVNEGESSLRRVYITGPSDIDKALLHINQTDADSPFFNIEGKYHGATPTGYNILGIGGTESIVGYFRVHIDGSFGGGPNADYWVPFYNIV
jgi:hypothetical protein